MPAPATLASCMQCVRRGSCIVGRPHRPALPGTERVQPRLAGTLASPLPPTSARCAAPACCRTPHPGGAPANVATGVARLGPKCVFLGAIGKDDLGDQFVQLLQGERGEVWQVGANRKPFLVQGVCMGCQPSPWRWEMPGVISYDRAWSKMLYASHLGATVVTDARQLGGVGGRQAQVRAVPGPAVRHLLSWEEVLAGDTGRRCWEEMAGGDAGTPTSPSAWLHPAHGLKSTIRGCTRETGPGAAAARQSPPLHNSPTPLNQPPCRRPPCAGPHALLCPAVPCADRQVDTSHIQRVDRPTRDILVERSLSGDRHFAGLFLVCN